MTNDFVLFHVERGGGWITLNRPQALNAINLHMVSLIAEHLRKWEADPEVNYVVIQGMGRAFCAGGDLRGSEDMRSIPQQEFFEAEYGLNLFIHNYSKPYVALLNGITMGGGMGLSIHGTYRIVTENTLMAMPETGIGLFPDVGAAWFLNRCPGKIGLYLGLTSARFGCEDAIYTGLGTHFIPAANLQNVMSEVRAENLAEVLKAQSQVPAGESFLKQNQGLIDGFFNQETIEDIFRALVASETGFAVETLAALKKRSPLSLRKTFVYLQAARSMSIEEVMQADLDMMINWVKSPESAREWQEGIRAAIIDKDQNPQWLSLPIEY